jgi:hypothetical protein
MAESFNPDEGSFQSAEQFADLSVRLIGGSRLQTSEAPDPRMIERENLEIDMMAARLVPNTPVVDIAADTKSFGRQYAFASYHNLPIASVHVPEIGEIPVLMPEFEAGFPVDSWVNRKSSEVRDWWRKTSTRVRGASPEADRFIDRTTVLEGFRKGLAMFLAYRLAGTRWTQNPKGYEDTQGRHAPGAAAFGNSGFQVELTCHYPGLAAYASPAYALTWRNLGSFTSPATGVLPPGVWIFGAEGSPLQKFTYDEYPVHVPPNFTPYTRRF